MRTPVTGLLLACLLPAPAIAAIQDTPIARVPFEHTNAGDFSYPAIDNTLSKPIMADYLWLAARDDNGNEGNWKNLSKEEKEKIRKAKERFESLPPEERERIKRARDNYEKMPPDERKALRKKWENMSDEEKRQYKIRKKN